MHKKTTSISALTLCFLSSLSMTQANSSFYVGGSLGHQSAALKNEKKLFTGDAASTSSKAAGNGISGSFHIGYDYVLNKRFYLGLEASLGLSSLQTKQTESYGLTLVTTEAQQKDFYSLSFKPGISFNNVFGYLKAGMTFSQWKLRSKLSFTDVPNKDLRKYIMGFDVGVGVDVPLHEKMSVGLLYSTTFFQKRCFSNFNSAGTEILRTKISPQVNTFSLRVNYKI